jgi:hypothetical protein
MAAEADGDSRRRTVALVALRLLAALVAESLLLWAYLILSNIWINDDDALSIIAIAAVPTVLGLLAAVFAVRGRLGILNAVRAANKCPNAQ